MTLDITTPADDSPVHTWPEHIRELKSALLTEGVQGVTFEAGIDQDDAVFLDSPNGIWRKSLAGHATRNRFHGFADVSLSVVQVFGFRDSDAWIFNENQLVYVSSADLGALTVTNTGLVAGIAVTADTVLIDSSQISGTFEALRLEVEAARGIEDTLLERLDSADAALATTVTEIVSARGSASDLAGALQTIETLASGVQSEVIAARGTLMNLAARLAVSINTDGTLKATVSAEAFIEEVDAITRISGTQFTMASDKSAVYAVKRTLRFNDATVAYVSAVSYTSPTMTVTVTGASIPTPLTKTEYSFAPGDMPRTGHEDLWSILGADPTDTDTGKIKHVSNAQLKLVTDHAAATGNTHSANHAQLGSIGVADETSADTTKDKHCSNNQLKVVHDFVATKAAASGIASLNASSKVVQNPANAQTTPAENKIPVAGVGGYIDPSWVAAQLAKASGIEVAAMTNDTKYVTPLGLANFAALSENYLLNPNFDIHLHYEAPVIGESYDALGTTFYDYAPYIHRWRGVCASNACALALISDSTSPTKRAMSVTLGAGSNDKFLIYQGLHDGSLANNNNRPIKQFIAGKTLTFSVLLKVSNVLSLPNIKLVAYKHTYNTSLPMRNSGMSVTAWNTSDTPPVLSHSSPASAFDMEATSNLNVTTAWARYSLTVTLDTSDVRVLFGILHDEVTGGSGSVLYLTNARVTEGEGVKEVYNRSFVEEVQLCNQYTYSLQARRCAGRICTTTLAKAHIPFGVRMHNTPLYVGSMGAGGNTNIEYLNTSGTGASTPSISAANQESAELSVPATGLVAGQACTITTTSGSLFTGCMDGKII